jgi:hypothetical protein
MKTPEIYGDFHNLDDDNRIRLTTFGTSRDLARLGLQLKDGMAVIVYMDDADDAGTRDDLMADAIIRYNKKEKCWVADLDWDKVCNRSEREKPKRRGRVHVMKNGAATTAKKKRPRAKRRSVKS